uniref:Uncharacterized protein n=1 Tax=Physcomitrium patens TaxID=3218 RepID=A0A2K1L0D0_PHYPA|nr:hypothetical protein PHYPA_002275 [Physcomitrium patens]
MSFPEFSNSGFSAKYLCSLNLLVELLQQLIDHGCIVADLNMQLFHFCGSIYRFHTTLHGMHIVYVLTYLGDEH